MASVETDLKSESASKPKPKAARADIDGSSRCFIFQKSIVISKLPPAARDAEKDEHESLFERLNDESKNASADNGDKLPANVAYDEDGNPYSTVQPGVIEKLAPLDHKSIKYPPIKKCFYTESPEVAQRSWSEINELRRSKSTNTCRLHLFFLKKIVFYVMYYFIQFCAFVVFLKKKDISVEGEGSFKPISSFTQCNLERRVLAYLTKRNFLTPTDIQSEVCFIIIIGIIIVCLKIFADNTACVVGSRCDRSRSDGLGQNDCVSRADDHTHRRSATVGSRRNRTDRHRTMKQHEAMSE